jgi:adenosylcobinamide kinase/adenosylcobinamide-phosphate guanylyltransferase
VKTLILGGARSGKSAFAESLLANLAAVDYIATGAAPSADDPEWAARVRAHQAQRPRNWRTVETLDLAGELSRPHAAPALVECVSTWLAAVMDEVGIWTDAAGADALLAARADEFVAAWTRSARPVVAVSNEVGLSVVPATVSGRRYRDELGHLNLRLAATADEVLLVIAGLAQKLK